MAVRQDVWKYIGGREVSCARALTGSPWQVRTRSGRRDAAVFDSAVSEVAGELEVGEVVPSGGSKLESGVVADSAGDELIMQEDSDGTVFLPVDSQTAKAFS